MDKLYELLLDKIEKKISTKAFMFVLGVMALLLLDYSNKILLESIKSVSILLIFLFSLLIIYYLYIKKQVKNFAYEHDCREYEDDRYVIDCEKYDITINHRKKCVLWNGKPHIIFEIKNKSNEIIENIEGYIDLFVRETCIIHQKIKIDYVLPQLAKEEKLLDDERAYRSWETAKFILIEQEQMKIFNGELRVMLPDIDYWLIKNKTWYVMKLKLERLLVLLKWIWNGGGYKIGRRKDYIIRQIKKYSFRIILIICSLLLIGTVILLLFILGREIYDWAKLHVNTYINLINKS